MSVMKNLLSPLIQKNATWSLEAGACTSGEASASSKGVAALAGALHALAVYQPDPLQLN